VHHAHGVRHVDDRDLQPALAEPGGASGPSNDACRENVPPGALRSAFRRHGADVSEPQVRPLQDGPARWLRDWRTDTAVKYRTGLYALWHGDRFLYVGIARTASSPGPEGDGKWGLWGRLGTHANGASRMLWRKIATRFVVPDLTDDDRDAMARGHADELLDQRVRAWLHEHVRYRTLITPDGPTAGRLESHVRRVGLPDAGPPELNPHRQRS
jgi:hypothetical protein